MSAAAATAIEGLPARLGAAARRVGDALDEMLPPDQGAEARVKAAMRYAALAGGKRLRPFLVMESGRLFEASETGALRAAAAIEAVHTYSLVHDDLPAMDDDDLRRGKPTVHVAYDDATAILAGDGLLTIAFEWLSDARTHPDPEVRCRLIQCLAKASGVDGMVGGQMIDLVSEGAELSLMAVSRLHAMKTGALIAGACAMGAILGQADADSLRSIRSYGEKLGLAFQIADDVLDVEGSDADLGKTAGKDAAQGKSTFVSIMGLEQAKAEARRAAAEAEAALASFGPRAADLRDLAAFVVERRA